MRRASGEPRRLDTSKLARYAAVRDRRGLGGSAAAAKPGAAEGAGAPPQGGAAPPEQPARTEPQQAAQEARPAAAEPTAAARAEGEADAAQRPKAEPTAGAEAAAPRWEVVDVDVGLAAPKRAQELRLSKLQAGAAAKAAQEPKAGGGALMCNGEVRAEPACRTPCPSPHQACRAAAQEMVSSPAPGAKAGEAADAMDVGQTQSEPESDGQEDEWEYDYYAVVPEGGGAGGDGWMGAVEMDTAGGSGANADWVRKHGLSSGARLDDKRCSRVVCSGKGRARRWW